MKVSKDALTPFCKSLFEKTLFQLPPAISTRLTCSRAVRNHGSYRTLFLFNAWDKYQSDILPKQHFCYCLGYDSANIFDAGTQWYFHLWLNTVRIYRDRLAVKQTLEDAIRRACPKAFKFEILDRAISAKISFDLNDPSELVQFLTPHYVAAVKAFHPILMPIIDRYSHYGREQVKQETAVRGRIAVAPVRMARPDLIREYTRSIPPSWRTELLEKWKHQCAECCTSLVKKKHHIDHIVPFSKEGRTVIENLRPLCPRCNLVKGNRF